MDPELEVCVGEVGGEGEGGGVGVCFLPKMKYLGSSAPANMGDDDH